MFGVPEEKDEVASGAYAEDGIVQRGAARVARAACPSSSLMTDVCLCEYTSHGHCGAACATARSDTT